MRSAALPDVPRRTAWRVTTPKKISTRFIQDAPVGMKCSVMRGCLGPGPAAYHPRRTGAVAVIRPDLPHRDFTAPSPNQRRVAGFTYVPIATGTAYAAFIVDCFSRFIRRW
jgi:transposase InsO family protein